MIERRTRRNAEGKPSFSSSIFKKEQAKKSASDEALSVEESCECDETPFFDFEEQHESKLEERMKHMSDTYSEYLMYLIRERNIYYFYGVKCG